MADRMLNVAEVCELTGVSRTSIWRLQRAGEFPAPRRLIGHRVAWLSSEIGEWIEARPVVGSEAGDDQAA